MASIVLGGLEKIVSDVGAAVDAVKPTSGMHALAFLDLSGSTAMKVTDGHEIGARSALRFVGVASEITRECGGVVVQN